MSDWQVGDLAVCVDGSPCRSPSLCGLPFTIAEGRVLKVVEVTISRSGKVGLNFDGVQPSYPGKRAFASYRFRKILPDKHESCEPEFQTLLQTFRRRVSA